MNEDQLRRGKELQEKIQFFENINYFLTNSENYNADDKVLGQFVNKALHDFRMIKYCKDMTKTHIEVVKNIESNLKRYANGQLTNLKKEFKQL